MAISDRDKRDAKQRKLTGDLTYTVADPLLMGTNSTYGINVSTNSTPGSNVGTSFTPANPNDAGGGSYTFTGTFASGTPTWATSTAPVWIDEFPGDGEKDLLLEAMNLIRDAYRAGLLNGVKLKGLRARIVELDAGLNGDLADEVEIVRSLKRIAKSLEGA